MLDERESIKDLIEQIEIDNKSDKVSNSYKSLLVAIITRSILDLDSDKPSIRTHARAFFLNSDKDVAFSFLWILEQLEVEHLRSSILQLIQASLYPSQTQAQNPKQNLESIFALNDIDE